MKKKLFSLVLATILAISTTNINVFASSDISDDVTIMPEAASIPDEVIEQIINENPDCDIVIYEYIELDESDAVYNTLDDDCDENGFENDRFDDEGNEDDESGISTYSLSPPIVIPGKITTTKSNIRQNQILSDQFKFSVAKGESVTLTYTIEGSFKGSISGSTLKKSDIGAEITLRGKYTRGTTYSGPPENSSYNSREYRMKFYGETGSYRQTQPITTIYSNGRRSISNKERTGTYKKPTSFASYSINKRP